MCTHCSFDFAHDQCRPDKGCIADWLGTEQTEWLKVILYESTLLFELIVLDFHLLSDRLSVGDPVENLATTPLQYSQRIIHTINQHWTV